MIDLSKRGRKIVVDGKEWAYRVGKISVIAYSEDGERRCEPAWKILGLDCPDTFARGQWKKTSDGMLTPKAVAEWLRK